MKALVCVKGTQHLRLFWNNSLWNARSFDDMVRGQFEKLKDFEWSQCQTKPKRFKHMSLAKRQQLQMQDSCFVSTVSFEETRADLEYIGHCDLFHKCTLIVGIHADIATEYIVDCAIEFNTAFAVVPCCVFPKSFPQRRLKDGTQVKTLSQFLLYLVEKGEQNHLHFQTHKLRFDGQNTVVYYNPKR